VQGEDRLAEEETMKLNLIAAMAAVLVAGVVQAGEGGCPLTAKKAGEGCAVKADGAATADATAKACCGKEGCKGSCKAGAAAKDKDAAKCGGTCPKKAEDKAPAAEGAKPADAGEKKEEAPAEKPAAE
jgi:hypothetical protein